MKRSILFGCFFLVLIFSCKKNQLGGKSTIKGTVMHHEKVIPYARVFLKFKAKDFPGTDTAVYDSKYTTGADGHYEFKCYKGDYYLYGFGYDTGISENVSGGTPVHIRNKETVEMDVPVTE
jgi:hypothetical protein